MSNTEKEKALVDGRLCPKCEGYTTTYRHPFAKKWCIDCGYVLRESGDRTPYDYKKHLDEKK